MFSLTFRAPHEQDLKIWGVWSRGRSLVCWTPWVGTPAHVAVWPWVNHFPSLTLTSFSCKVGKVTSFGKVMRTQREWQWEQSVGVGQVEFLCSFSSWWMKSLQGTPNNWAARFLTTPPTPFLNPGQARKLPRASAQTTYIQLRDKETAEHSWWKNMAAVIPRKQGVWLWDFAGVQGLLAVRLEQVSSSLQISSALTKMGLSPG